MKLALKKAVLIVKRAALCYVIASTGSFQNAFHPPFLNARTALFIESCGSSCQIICRACFSCSLFAGFGDPFKGQFQLIQIFFLIYSNVALRRSV